MPLKSNRGIQQEDVWQAADALIAEGLRPTIERVRQKIGRGSPNTVSPLLDVWFSTLATRLGLGGAKEEGVLPEPVQQAVSLLWETALLSARDEAAQALAQEHQALSAKRVDMERKATDFEHQKQVLQARQHAADEALQGARDQLSDKVVRLEALGTLLARRENEIEKSREKLTELEAVRDAGLRRSEEEARRHAEERTRLETRATANERRLLDELDRERQDAKRLKAELGEQERCAAATHARLETANLGLADRLHQMEYEFKAGQQTLASANLRVSELNDLLEAQKSAHAATLKQLNLLLAGSSRKPLGRLPIRRRRI